MCHAAGQAKSAQILLRYGPGDWNALHRDVFGAMVFLPRSSSASTHPESTSPAASSS